MSDVEKIISDIIFPTSYVVFPTSNVVFGVFGGSRRFGYFANRMDVVCRFMAHCANCRGVLHTPCTPPHEPHGNPPSKHGKTTYPANHSNINPSTHRAAFPACSHRVLPCGIIGEAWQKMVFYKRQTIPHQEKHGSRFCVMQQKHYVCTAQ